MIGYPQMERVVLSTIIKEHEILNEALSMLGMEYFSDNVTVNVYNLIVDMVKNNEFINPITVKEYLNRKQAQFQIQQSDLDAIIEIECDASLINTYIDSLDKYVKMKKVLAISESVKNGIMNGQDPDTIMELFNEKINQIITPVSNQSLNIDETFSAIVAYAKEGNMQPIPLFLEPFDSYGIGIYRKEINIIAARPGQGKSTFAIDRTREWLQRGYSVMWFMLEMSVEQAIGKLICNLANVDFEEWKRGHINEIASRRIDSAREEWKTWNNRFFFYDNIYFAPYVAKEVRKHKPDIVIVDYIQLIAGKSDDKKQRIDESVRYLKRVFKDTNSAGLIISQVNRESEKMPDNVPRLSHLAESDGLSQDAALVGVIYWEYTITRDGKDKNKTALYFVKHRFGNVAGTNTLKFFPEYSRYASEEKNPDQLTIEIPNPGGT